jgi:hypothetical protein
MYYIIKEIIIQVQEGPGVNIATRLLHCCGDVAVSLYYQSRLCRGYSMRF